MSAEKKNTYSGVKFRFSRDTYVLVHHKVKIILRHYYHVTQGVGPVFLPVRREKTICRPCCFPAFFRSIRCTGKHCARLCSIDARQPVMAHRKGRRLVLFSIRHSFLVFHTLIVFSTSPTRFGDPPDGHLQRACAAAALMACVLSKARVW